MKSLTSEKKQFTLRLPEDTYQKVSEIAEKEKRSLTLQIEYIVERFIAEYEKAGRDT